MKLLIVSICVNYVDFLSFCFQKNQESLNNHYYNIITDSKDSDTQKFCYENNINYFVTDAFYAKNHKFNKGRAMNDFFDTKKFPQDFEYVLLLDSDCIFNNVTDPRSNNVLDCFLNLTDKNQECLYSCGRRIYNTLKDYNNLKFIQGNCYHIGFFQLFHKSKLDLRIPEYRNASVYDCELSKKFTKHRCLPCDVDHIGPIYMNWDGRHPKSNKWL